MNFDGSIALVTGANRGLGRLFVVELLARGASKVYATARDPRAIDAADPRVVPLALDVTDAEAVAAAAAAAPDVTLLVNNAGVATGADLLTGDLGAIRREIDTNFYGPLLVTRAFAPVLAAADGGGAILNVLSVMSWSTYQGANAYGAAKAAAWSLTNAARQELAGQGTRVTGLYMGATDTDMMAGVDVPKNDPDDVVRQALDGVAAGVPEVLADQGAVAAKAALAA